MSRNSGAAHPIRSYNSNYQTRKLDPRRRDGVLPYRTPYQDDYMEALPGNPNLGVRANTVAYTSDQVHQVHQNADFLLQNAIEDSKKFAKKKISDDFDTLYQYVDLRLSNANSFSNSGSAKHFIYNIGNLSRGNGLRENYSSVNKIKSGKLRIHNDAFPDFSYSDELFISIRETTNSYANSNTDRIRRYNFRLIREAAYSQGDWNVYIPDERFFQLLTWSDFTQITVTISNISGEIVFPSPIVDAQIIAGPVTTIIGEHNLVNGDLIYFDQLSGLFPVTIIDSATFTIPFNVGNNYSEYKVFKFDFTYNLILSNIKQDGVGFNC